MFNGPDQDKDLIKKLTEPDELSRILNTLLEPARALLQARGPIYEQSETKIRQAWLSSSSSMQYAAGSVRIDPNAPKTKTTAAYQEYALWCTEHKKRLNLVNTFNTHLEAAGFVKKRTSVNGVKGEYWINMARAGDPPGKPASGQATF